MLRLRNLMLALVMAAVAPAAADASLIMSLTPSGPSLVTLSYSGFINSSGLISTGGTLATTATIQPNSGLIQNISSVALFVTGSSAGGQNFGSGTSATAVSSSGSPIYVNFGAPSLLGLPAGYASGSPLTGSMTFAGTFASLGFTDNMTYTFSWGGGGPGNSVSFTVTSVPEPATMGILAIGSVLGGYGYRRRLKKTKQQAVIA